MKQNNFKEATVSVISEIISLIIIGFLGMLVYHYPLHMNRMTDFFLIIGIAAILLFNILYYSEFKIFLITLAVFIFGLPILIFKNPTILSYLHHVLWILGLGIIIFLLKKIYPEKNTLRSRIIIILLWIAALTAFFMIVFIGNGCILRYRHAFDTVDFGRIVIRALKYGPALGIGIGLGNFISLTIYK